MLPFARSPEDIQVLASSFIMVPVADQQVVANTVPLPEVYLKEAFSFTCAGPAACAAFLRAQSRDDPAVKKLEAPVPGAPSVTISMSKRSSGGVTLSGPQAQVFQACLAHACGWGMCVRGAECWFCGCVSTWGTNPGCYHACQDAAYGRPMMCRLQLLALSWRLGCSNSPRHAAVAD